MRAGRGRAAATPRSPVTVGVTMPGHPGTYEKRKI